MSALSPALSPLGGGTEEQVGLKWLLRVRWGAVASQVAVLAVAKVLFAVELELELMVGLLAFVGASNLILWVAPTPRGDWLTGHLDSGRAGVDTLLASSGALRILHHLLLGARARRAAPPPAQCGDRG
jgi:hypothetical protein